MSAEFRTFLGSLPARSGYCLDCLSQMYEKRTEIINEYLEEIGLRGRHAHCGNCGEHRELFHAKSSD